MSIKTKISWADSSCNPTMGCTGCELYPLHCYAFGLCNRWAGRKGYPEVFTRPEYFPGRIEKALGWRDLTGTKRPDKPWLDDMPRIIFIDDMGDGFCPDIDPELWLAPHLSAMTDSRHIWLFLTKWPERMAAFFRYGTPRNFWLGTSILRWQDMWRLNVLLNIPASTHFVSVEPMLEKISLFNYLANNSLYKASRYAGEGNFHGERQADGSVIAVCDDGTRFYDGVDLAWIVAGCESGPNRRHTNIDWLRDLRNQCQKAGTPFFLKQRDIGGTLTHMPELDGKIWSELPNGL